MTVSIFKFDATLEVVVIPTVLLDFWKGDAEYRHFDLFEHIILSLAL